MRHYKKYSFTYIIKETLGNNKKHLTRRERVHSSTDSMLVICSVALIRYEGFASMCNAYNAVDKLKKTYCAHSIKIFNEFIPSSSEEAKKYFAIKNALSTIKIVDLKRKPHQPTIINLDLLNYNE
jgi:hypothetical protein